MDDAMTNRPAMKGLYVQTNERGENRVIALSRADDGSLPARDGDARRLVGTVTHLADDDRYRWLNDVVCTLAGEVRPRAGGTGFDVVIEVSELAWEPLGP